MRSHEPMRARRADDPQGLRRVTGASDAPSDILALFLSANRRSR
jgi:hypothetical protein